MLSFGSLDALRALLPQNATARGALLAGVAVVGASLWLGGARYGRALLTALSCAAGGALAYQAPAYFNWAIDPMATCVAGALVGGIAGFLTHRLLAAVALCLTMALASGAALLLASGLGTRWTLPPMTIDAPVHQALRDGFAAAPLLVQRDLMACAIFAVITALGLSLRFERFAFVLLWSMSGLALMLSFGAMAAQVFCPAALRLIPVQASMQSILSLALIAFGVVFQWRLAEPMDNDSAGAFKRPPTPQPQAIANIAPRPARPSAAKPILPKFRMAMDD